MLHFGPRVTELLSISARFEQGGTFENWYEISLTHALPNRLIPKAETACFWDKRSHPQRPYSQSLDPIGDEAGISQSPTSRVPGYITKYLDDCRIYHFDDTGNLSPLKETADLHDNRFLRPDGSNLAAFLHLLRQRHDDAYGLIVRTVQQVAPFFVDFDLDPLELSPDKIRLQWKHAGSDAYWDVSSLSSGTLRFIALATLFLQPDQYKPTVITVDEPELGLHPYAITLLASLLKRASIDTQVIVSTQSSLLLDHFGPEDVVVAERIDGSTKLNRLEASELEAWLEDYSMGQLWEKNILGGRPRPE